MISGEKFVGFTSTLMYIYRYPHSDVHRFLEKLETLIVKERINIVWRLESKFSTR